MSNGAVDGGPRPSRDLSVQRDLSVSVDLSVEPSPDMGLADLGSADSGIEPPPPGPPPPPPDYLDGVNFEEVLTLQGARLPERVGEVAHLTIAMSDGVELGGRLWLPEGALTTPVPAILLSHPYGKDGAGERAENAYYAGRGYASLRIDVRGTGTSQGQITDEYTLRERMDLAEVIAWLASQPWCSGRVGMTGSSWSGFSAVQAAGMNIPALGGVIVMNASERRFTDDAHYMGGILLKENFMWGTNFLSDLVRPPDAQLWGEDWQPIWQARLQQLIPPIHTWITHSYDPPGGYWDQGSVAPSDIQIPVYAVGGWMDGYTNSIARLVSNNPSNRRGLIGPWGHSPPHWASHHALHFMEEAIAFWDYCLKGQPGFMEARPQMRTFIQEDMHDPGLGYWVQDAAWTDATPAQRWYFGDGALQPQPSASLMLSHQSPQDVGIDAGEWIARNSAGEQSFDDSRSLTLDSSPLSEDLVLLGTPKVRVRLTPQAQDGHIFVRLVDVAPDGRATRVSMGMLNLVLKDGFDAPAPLVPGQPVDVTIPLHDMGYAFKAGHRLRLALSTAYWPMAWPSSQPWTMQIEAAQSWLDLPSRAPQPTDGVAPPFGPRDLAAWTEPPPGQRTEDGFRNSAVVYENDGTLNRYTDWSDGVYFDANGIRRWGQGNVSYVIHPDDPTSALAFKRVERSVQWPDGREGYFKHETTQTANATDFLLTTIIEVWASGQMIYQQTFDDTIPRR